MINQENSEKNKPIEQLSSTFSPDSQPESIPSNPGFLSYLMVATLGWILSLFSAGYSMYVYIISGGVGPNTMESTLILAVILLIFAFSGISVFVTARLLQGARTWKNSAFMSSIAHITVPLIIFLLAIVFCGGL